ncbi:MAG TPA: methyltransferase [Sulfurimonas sp. UBA12504]|nr:MAG: methyltransferase [Sulfurimonas sp. GWF2_37_8]DAB29374.1 MAG TPA: methyltransferase [Sulfurimonas sp. UBA12504]
MRVNAEFSKYANHYGVYNVIQNQVAAKLLSYVKGTPKKILDLGCGNGALCKNITWKYDFFKGIDFAQGMLELHPKSSLIEAVYGDFNDQNLFDLLQADSYEYVFSASALQWAENLEMVFENIKKLAAPVAFAIFTAGTFTTLNATASLEPLLRSKESIDELQKKYFDAEFEVVQYKLEFESTREMFRYIKQSGVSASRRALDYKATKKLMREYPLNYLEFEVAFIYSR